MKNSGGNWNKKGVIKCLLAVIIIITAIFGSANSKSIVNFANKYLAAGDVPAHKKTLTPNNDGTYQLELSVTGDADTKVETAANVNVLIIYDVSQSMTTNVSGSNRSRADNTEDVVHDFIENLRGYQNTSDPRNIQVALVTFGPSARERSGWTTDLTSGRDGINRFFDDGVDGTTDPANVFNYSSNLGTNWDDALRVGSEVLEDADEDPTFVILFTDGVCTASGTGGGESPTNANWIHYRDYYNAAAPRARSTQTRADTTLFGIYAYGNEHDLLDDLIYYSNEGEHRTIGRYNLMQVPNNQNTDYNFGATTETENYYNAGDTAALSKAIDEIFQKVVKALGISSVQITDGTTNGVELSSNAPLLNVDDDSFKYWLEIPLIDNKFERVDLISGETITYTATNNNNGTYTITWGTNNSVTVKGSPVTGGFKYQWESKNALYNYDPPTAHLDEEGAVKWDLSSVDALLDGVTYSVTFDVYPSQDTYDFIADVKNVDNVVDRKAKYDALPTEVKTYLKPTSDAYFDYTLLTNTDTELKYTDTRTGQTKTAEFNPVDAVPTDADTISIQKTFKNELDPASHGAVEVEVNLNRDGKEFTDYTLNSGNNWTKNDIFIATGLARLKAGKLEILDAGHDYTFSELGDEQFNWELISETVHPMLINGILKELVLLDEKELQKLNMENPPTLSGNYLDNTDVDGRQYVKLDNGNIYYISGKAPTIHAINHRRSNFNVKKIVSGVNANPNDEFVFTIKIIQRDEKNEIIVDDPTTNNDDLWFSVYGTNGNTQLDEIPDGWTEYQDSKTGDYYYYAPNKTELVVKLKNNDNLRFTNLVSNTEFSVVETDKDNYSLDEIETTNGFETEEEKEKLVIDVNTNKITGYIKESNTSYQVEYTNKNDIPEPTTVPVKKVWDDNDDQDGLRNYVTFELYGANNTKVNEYKFTEQDCTGNTCEYTFTKDSNGVNLPKYSNGQEIEYTIKETGKPNGYDASEPRKENGVLVITNTHKPEETTVPVKKIWEDEDNQDGLRGSVTFNLYGIDKTTPINSHTFNLNSEECNNNKCSYTFTKDNNNVNLPKKANGKVINYTIEEVFGSKYYESSDPTEDKEGNVVITNTHNPFETEITVLKIWNDDNNRDNARDNIVLSISAGDFPLLRDNITLSNSTSWSGKWEHLPKFNAGKPLEFTVTELTNLPGYTSNGPIKITPDETDKYQNNTIEYQITNNRVYDKVEIPVKKVWDDNNDQDGIRDKEKITFELYGVDKTTPVNTYTFETNDCPNNECSYTFTKDSTGADLPKYESGKVGVEINYTIKETGVSREYTASEPTKENGVLVITNTHKPEVTTVPVKKVWDDNDDQDGLRDFVTFELYGENNTKLNEYKFTEDNCNAKSCEYTFTKDSNGVNLPKYSNGQEIEYTIKETGKPNGYDASEPRKENGVLVITNTHKPEVTKVPVKKVWDDNDDQDGIRDKEKITFELYGVDKNTPVNTYTFETNDCPNNECSYTFTKDSKGVNLPKYETGKVGVEINYTIKETGVSSEYKASEPTKEDGTLVITNTHKPEVTTVPVKKVWDDNDDQDGLRNFVTFELYGANNTKVNEYKFTEADCNVKSCEYTFTKDSNGLDLPKYSNGQEIAYTIKETEKLNGYEASEPTKENGVLVITNTHKPEETKVPVKKVWDDNDDQDGLRNFVTFELYGANNTKVNEYKFTEADCNVKSCEYTFTKDSNGVNLPKYSNGKEIEYTIKETGKPRGYEASEPTKEAGVLVITNTHKPEETTVPVKKIWEDEDNQDGLRDSITFNLYGVSKETPVASHTFTEDECENSVCSYIFTKDNNNVNLPKKANGKVINYTIEEVFGSKYYESSDPTEDEEGNVVITNTHNPFETEITVLKIWNDDNNRDNARDNIVLSISAGDFPLLRDNITLSESSGWRGTWKQLPKFNAGKPLEFTVTELTNLPGYTSNGPIKITPDETDKYQNNTIEYQITNNRVFDKVEIPVKKVWDDNNDQDGIRDKEKITFELYGVDKNTPVNTYTFETNDCPNNECSYTFTKDSKGADLPKYETGKVGSEINYTIKETGVSSKYTASEPTKEDGVLVITNTHKPEVTTVSGNKTWNDKNNQDGIRPKTITVYIKDGDNIVDTISEVTGKSNAETWSFTSKELPKYREGKEIEYTVDEKLPDGYTKEIKGNNIINTYKPQVKTVKGTKVWDDFNNIDGKRPSSITVYVKDGTTIVDTINVSGDDTAESWNYESKELPKYKNEGKEIEYTVEEEVTGVTDKGYSVNIDGKTITNTRKPEVIEEFPITKSWIDNSNSEGFRPNSVDIQLLADGEAYKDPITIGIDEDGNPLEGTTIEGNNWKYVFKNLPKYTHDAEGKGGKEIVYSIKEVNLDANYKAEQADNRTIVNTIDAMKKEIPVKKIWDDASNQDGYRPDSIEFTLTGTVASEEKPVYTKTITLTGESDTWEGKFVEVPIFYKGTLITYTVNEVVTKDLETYYPETKEETVEGVYTITNKHVPETTEVTIGKTWDDNNDQDGKRPASIEVTLTGNGKSYGPVKIGLDEEGNPLEGTTIKDNTWSYTFTNLPKKANGEDIEYVVSESEVDNYNQLNIISNVITNKHVPATISYLVEKDWVDYDNQDGKRPEFITVTLIGKVGDTEVYNSTIEVRPDENGDWKYSFNGLNKYNKGQLIQYTLTEGNVDLYETDSIVDIPNEEGTTSITNTITNRHKLETIDITIRKVWDDFDNKYNSRPTFVKVHILADGEAIESAILNEENGWTYTFEGLIKNREGEVETPIEYTVAEDTVQLYKASISKNDYVFTITNTYDGPTESEIVPPKTGILPTKDYTFYELLMNLILLAYSLVYLKKVEN